MRIHTLLIAIPLTWFPIAAAAQTPPAPAAPAGAQAPAAAAAEEEQHPPLPTTFGEVNFGLLVTHVWDGDAARYERYRDLSNGLVLDRGRFSTQGHGWVADLSADNLGRKDQRYSGNFTRPGQVKVWSQWDEIPMLMSRTTKTLFAPTSPNVLEMDNAIQNLVQANASYLSTALLTARTFTLESRRHIYDGGAEYIAKNGLTLDAHTRYIDRDGGIPFGGSFGHSQVVETIAPVQHTTTDFDSSAEYAQGNLLVRGGYTGSWFRNANTTLTFDNPFRGVDIPPIGTQAGASSRGRTALAPNNSFIGVNGMVSYRLPYKSRATAYVSVGSLNDTGDPIMPHTINTALAVLPLERDTVEGSAQTSSINLNFISRPAKGVDVDLRFRTYDYDNQTPEFTVTKRVGYDNQISDVASALQDTEPFGVKREAFDADAKYSPAGRPFSAGVGYSHLREERTHRIFEETNENTFRLIFDSISSRWFTLRSKYEHTQRRGVGDATTITDELNAIGEQGGMRHFDIASRNRDRLTTTGMLFLTNSLSANLSYATGKDDYLESEFGLRDNNHHIYSTGLDFTPSDYVSTGISYEFERYTSLSRSRQANPTTPTGCVPVYPPPAGKTTCQFNDPSRNWATDTTDSVHSVIGHADFLQLVRHLDLAVWGDYNLTRGRYLYTAGAVEDRTLPEEVVVPSSLPPPTQLPLVRSGLGRGSVDLTYALGERWGLGFSVYFEIYRIKDFSLDAEAQSRLDPAGALLLGYEYSPYTASTTWGRVFYKF